MKKCFCLLLMVTAVFLMAGTAAAATSVAWVSPTNGSSYPVGTIVNPSGQASATGTAGGTGLDLALVLDSSGSMTSTYSGKSLQQYQKDAAHALVNALPANTTSVTVIQFDSSASTYLVLTALNSNIASVHAAIDMVDAYGGTYIGSGISKATTELTGVYHTAGRQQVMVVMSDGYTSGYPETNAVAAMAAGVDAIHTVGLPGHSVATMQDIADGPDDSVGTADDYGTYSGFNTATDLNNLIGIFAGTSGSLVGIDHVEITLPDGTVLNSANGDFTVDGLGNFQIPSPYWAMLAGANTFTATAYGTDQTVASATLTLNGTGNQSVPEPATMLLFGTGLLGLFGIRRRNKNKA